jgi:hypothetical protein
MGIVIRMGIDDDSVRRVYTIYVLYYIYIHTCLGDGIKLLYHCHATNSPRLNCLGGGCH